MAQTSSAHHCQDVSSHVTLISTQLPAQMCGNEPVAPNSQDILALHKERHDKQ